MKGRVTKHREYITDIIHNEPNPTIALRQLAEMCIYELSLVGANEEIIRIFDSALVAHRDITKKDKDARKVFR